MRSPAAAILAAWSCLAVPLAADQFGDFTYTEYPSGITITGYPDTATGWVEIPATINGKPVTTIGSNAFAWCIHLTGVTIPSTVTLIADMAFYQCASFTTLTIPHSVQEIRTLAFGGCWRVVGVTFEAPSSVKSIHREVFYNCRGLTGVFLPYSVTSIGDDVFGLCTSLTLIRVDERNAHYSSEGGVLFDKARTQLIRYPAGLAGVFTIPASVTSIAAHAFASCAGLTAILVDGANPNYASRDGVLFNKLETLLVQYPGGRTGDYTMPATVTTLADDSFYDCDALTGVTVAPSVTAIPANAFRECGGLASVTFATPCSVTSIGTYAFFDCDALATIRIPTSVTGIGDGAFSNCGGLTSVDFAAPSAVASIGGHAFESCHHLTGIAFPSSVTSIGSYAFGFCEVLSGVTVPSAVTSIGSYAFYYCTRLTRVTIAAPATNIGDYAFRNCSQLSRALFLGAAPATMGVDVFYYAAAGFTVYYRAGATGFSTPVWRGYTAYPQQVPQFTSPPLPATGVVGTAYLHACTVTAVPAATFAVTAGTLPPGLWIYDNGIIAGNPTEPGTFSGTITASNGFPEQTNQHFSITVRLPWIFTTGSANGSISGGGAHPFNSTATLLAIGNPGYVFAAWTGDASGSVNPLQVLVNSDKTIGATFEPDLADSDDDDLSNFLEGAVYGTNPSLSDSDGDGLSDAWEVGRGRFSIISGSFTWAQARADARSRHGDLACFPTEHRWNRAMETLGGSALDPYQGLWIGLTDEAADGTWIWVNGEPFAFSAWATGRPTTTPGNTLDYVEISGGDGAEISKWYDRAPTSVRDGYILETGRATDPTVADADGDGLNDGEEQMAGSDPFVADTDGDGLTDSQEVNLVRTKPTLADTDGDGTADADEDFDGDGFSNLQELRLLLTDPADPGSRFVVRTEVRPDGVVEFVVPTLTGRRYRVLRSPDCVTWTQAEEFAGSGAEVRLVVSESPPASRGFFRVAVDMD